MYGVVHPASEVCRSRPRPTVLSTCLKTCRSVQLLISIPHVADSGETRGFLYSPLGQDNVMRMRGSEKPAKQGEIIMNNWTIPTIFPRSPVWIMQFPLLSRWQATVLGKRNPNSSGCTQFHRFYFLLGLKSCERAQTAFFQNGTHLRAGTLDYGFTPKGCGCIPNYKRDYVGKRVRGFFQHTVKNIPCLVEVWRTGSA